MKKLLLSLSAVSITSGSVLSVVSCQNSDIEKQTKYISEQNLDIILTEVSKTVYLKETKDYDPNYLLDTYVQSKQIKEITDKELDIKDEFTNNFYFNELFDKYFKADFLPQNYAEGIKPQSKGFLDVISSLFKLMFGFIDNDGLKTLYDLLNKMGLSGMLPEQLFQFANGLLTKDDINAFANAFDDSIYEGLSYQETLNSSIIGLVNAFNKLTGNDKMFEYDSKENVAKNITPALESFQSNLKNIKNLKLDILEDMDALAEVLRFVRTMVMYINQFDYTQDLQWEAIQTIRNKPFDSNEMDLKKFLSQINVALSDPTGEATRRVMASMLQTHEESRIWNKSALLFPSTINNLGDSTIYNEGFGGLFKSLINGFINPFVLPESTPILGGKNVNFGAAIMDLIDLANSTKKISFTWNALIAIIATYLPDNLAAVVTNEEFKNDFFASIYNGENFMTQMGFNLNSMFDKKTIGYNETKLSMREMVAEMNNSLSQSTLKVNDETVANIFRALNTETEFEGQKGTVFELATTNSAHLLPILNTKVIDNKSALNFVDETLKDLAGLKDIFSFTQMWEEELQSDIQNSKNQFELDYATLNSQQIKVSDYQFEYQIDESKILLQLVLQNDYFKIENIEISSI